MNYCVIMATGRFQGGRRDQDWPLRLTAPDWGWRRPAIARLLDLGEYRRSGSSEVVRADLRIVSSSSRPYDEAAREGRLSPDLRFRLAGSLVTPPPLRARTDLAALAQRLLAAADPDLSLGEGAVAVIKAHDWTGNLHELRARMAHAALRAEGRVVRRTALAEIEAGPVPEDAGPAACPGCRGVPWKEQQCRLVRAEVTAVGGNIAQAARRMGMSRTTIYRHLFAEKDRATGAA